jgi:hypothetical protein
LSSGVLVASFLVRIDVIDKLTVPVGVIALSRGIPMGEARHVAVLIIGYGSSRRHSGSCRAPWLTTTVATSPPCSFLVIGDGGVAGLSPNC